MPELPLRDIHLPDPVSWWPLAIGWWLLIGITIILVMVTAVIVQRFIRQTLKKQAIKALKEIEIEFGKNNDATSALARISVLLRRIAVTRNPKDAGVIGEAWLKLLDSPHNLDLLSAPYRSEVTEEEVDQFFQLSKKVIHRL